MDRKPNILLIVSDQQRADLLGCAGNLPVKTPYLDELASEGVFFDRAYTPCPLCTPARASLLSGQYPSRHGAWSIGVDTPEDILSLPKLLNNRGYATCLIGKSHFQNCMSPDSPESLPASQDWDHFARWDGPWYGFEKAKICIGHGPETHAYAMHHGLFLRENGIPAEPPYFARSEDPHPNSVWGRWALPEEFHTSTWTANETISYLKDHLHNHASQPFFLSLNIPDPHLPFQVPEPWDTLHNDVDLPDLKRCKDEWKNKPTLYQATFDRRLPELGWHEQSILPCQYAEQTKSQEMTEDEMAKWRVYMGMQSLVDKNVGRVLSFLEEAGIKEDTIVVYTSDHGDYMGDHWIWSKGGSHYDSAIRVPLIVRWPGRIPEKKRSSSLQSLVDLAPTFLAAAGESPNPDMQGTNQLSVWKAPETQARRGVWIDHHVEKGLTVNSWITDQYRLSHHAIHAEQRDEWELYDFKEDPDEFTNLADQDHWQLRTELLSEMMRYQLECQEPRRRRKAFA